MLEVMSMRKKSELRWSLPMVSVQNLKSYLRRNDKADGEISSLYLLLFVIIGRRILLAFKLS